MTHFCLKSQGTGQSYSISTLTLDEEDDCLCVIYILNGHFNVFRQVLSFYCRKGHNSVDNTIIMFILVVFLFMQ